MVLLYAHSQSARYNLFSLNNWQHRNCIKLTIKLITFIVQFSHNYDFDTYSVKPDIDH